MTLDNGTDGQTDRQTDRVRRNMRPPPREEGRIKTHIQFAPTAGAHCAIFPKLCTVIELVESIKKVPIIFFDPAHSFFLQGARKKMA